MMIIATAMGLKIIVAAMATTMTMMVAIEMSMQMQMMMVTMVPAMMIIAVAGEYVDKAPFCCCFHRY